MAFRVAAAVVVVLALWVGSFALFRYGGLLMPVVAPTAGLALALWMAGVYVGREDRAQKRFVQQAFGRYLSPRLLEKLMDDPSKLAVGGERHELSFIFTDVAGFTTVSERMDAAELSSVLNRYFDGMCEIELTP